MPLKLFLLCYLIFGLGLSLQAQRRSGNNLDGYDTNQLLTISQMEAEAGRAARMVQNAINEMINMGRQKRPLEEVEEQLAIILPNFVDTAEMEVSSCISGNKKKYGMRAYLENQYKRAKTQYFVLHFEEPRIKKINWLEYEADVVFWQEYESKVYHDRTLKRVKIYFDPKGNNLYSVLIGSTTVVRTICD